MSDIKIGKSPVQRCRRRGIFQHEAFAKKGWIAQACGKIEIIDAIFRQIDQAFAVEIDAAPQQDRPAIERPVINAHTGFQRHIVAKRIGERAAYKPAGVNLAQQAEGARGVG